MRYASGFKSLRAINMAFSIKKTGSENPERLGLTGIRNGLLIHCQPTVSGVHTDKSRLISNRKSDGIFAYYLILEDIP